MMKKLITTLLLIGSVVIALATTAHVDLRAYPFSLVLYDQNNQYYGLHWNFTRETQSIYFAVNVSTTGWVGFGLSPNGQMPASDVVIGWINGGQTHFHDRFAEARRLPSIDPSQDWFLLNSEEENGFTMLEFSRNFTTCDDRDLDITSSTDRVVWSFSSTDPSGNDAVMHNYQGSMSVNLIGGLPTSRKTAPIDESTLDITVSNVTIPVAFTTYWCAGFKLPSELVNTTHYVTRISPVITPHAQSFVHHMLVYLCNSPIVKGAVGSSTPCSNADRSIGECRGLQGLVFGGWAIGGLNDFIYPEGVAYPIGGIGQDQFVVIEIHYDNPQNTPGVMDSSGMRFFYTLDEPTQRAGILSLGHSVTRLMLIPPSTGNYTVMSICSSNCTRHRIPEGGIKIFANLLHTHLIGRGLAIEQYRWNAEHNVWEELEPIDKNQKYDFNFQQLVHLPKEHLVLPGDILVLKCNYSTTGRPALTLGGLSTHEEMCLAFPFYYPRPPGFDILSSCTSLPDPTISLTDFLSYLQRINPAAAIDIASRDEIRAGFALSRLNWKGNPEIARKLQDSLLSSPAVEICRAESRAVNISIVTPPNVQYQYQPPDICSRNCCDSLSNATTDGRLATDGTTGTTTDGIRATNRATPQTQAFSLLLLFLIIYITCT